MLQKFFRSFILYSQSKRKRKDNLVMFLSERIKGPFVFQFYRSLITLFRCYSVHLCTIYLPQGRRVWDYTCFFKRTVSRHARRRKTPIGLQICGGGRGSPLPPRQTCLFKFNSTRGKQACASRARQTRETCVHVARCNTCAFIS